MAWWTMRSECSGKLKIGTDLLLEKEKKKATKLYNTKQNKKKRFHDYQSSALISVGVLWIWFWLKNNNKIKIKANLHFQAVNGEKALNNDHITLRCL